MWSAGGRRCCTQRCQWKNWPCTARDAFRTLGWHQGGRGRRWVGEAEAVSAVTANPRKHDVFGQDASLTLVILWCSTCARASRGRPSDGGKGERKSGRQENHATTVRVPPKHKTHIELGEVGVDRVGGPPVSPLTYCRSVAPPPSSSALPPVVSTSSVRPYSWSTNNPAAQK